MKADTVLVVPSPDSRAWGTNEKDRVDILFNNEWITWKNRSFDFKIPYTLRAGDGV